MSLAAQSQQWCPTSVQVTVLQARGLRIKGKNGTNDAYAVMQVAKDKYATSVVEKSVAPVWEEEAAFDLPPVHPGSSERCTLHVSVLHRALVGPDKLLGQAAINLWELSEDKSRNKTEWFKLLGKTGKADKDRGEVLLYIQFMRNNMTASMFDLSASGKPRSRLGKFKDKVRGKKKEGLSDASSTVVPSVTQVLTDSEEEEGPGDANGEGAAGKEEKKKKHKLKSLFSQKSNLQRNMSQSMSILPEKNSALSGSISSGLNVDSSEGKKKFKFKIHKRSGSSGGKGSQGPLSNPLKEGSAVEQSNLCINGSHIYCEEPQPRSSRTSSNFSLSSSGHGSMEELRRTQIQEASATSIDSLRTQRQCSPWTEEEESKRAAEEEEGIMEEEEERETLSKKEQESVRKIEEGASIIDEQWEKRQSEEDKMILTEQEKRRIEEEDKIRREEQERIRMEEKRAEEERRRKQEEEERVRKQKEENERLAEEKRRLEEEERRRIEEEEKIRQEQERIRMEKERAVEERRRRQEEEERLKKEEEERQRLAEEKRRLEEEERMRIEEEKKMRREEQERIRIEKERAEEERKRRQEEEERLQKQKEENERLAEEKRRLEEEERRRIEEETIRREEERIRMEKERAEEERKRRQEEEERVRKEEEERKRLAEEKRRLEEERMRTEEEERNRQEQERIRMEEQRAEEERKRKQEAEERARKEERERLAEEKRRLEEEERRRVEEEEKMRREEQERIRMEKERAEEEERLRKQKEENERLAEEKRRLEEEERRRIEEEEKTRQEQERIRMEKERAEEERKRRQEEEERLKKEEEERQRLAEEKRRLEEEERMRIEEEEKTRQEQERIRMENERAEEERKRRQEEEERARKQKEENERLAEEKRRQEEEEKLREEEKRMKEEMRLRDEEERQKRVEGEKGLREVGEERREREKANEVEEEMVSGEEKQGQKGQQIDGVKRCEQEQAADETRADLKLKEVTSTNPFDDDYSTNPFDEIPTSPAGPHSRTAKVSAVQPRYHSTVGSKEDLSLKETVNTDEKDHIHAQRDKRPAPQPPGRKRPETQLQKEQNVSTPHQTQTNKQTRNKDVKTSSVFPHRLVQMITPLSRSSSTTKGGQMPESQSSAQPDFTPSTTEAPRVAKHNKGPAPFRPQSSRVGGKTLKQAGEDGPSCEPKGASSSGTNQKDTNIAPVVYGSNPFEDDESETELPTSDNADSADSCNRKGSSSSNAGSLNSTAAARQTPDEDAASQTKGKSSKMARAPLPPAQKAAPSGTLESQNTDQGLTSKSQGSVTDVAVPDNSVTKGDDRQSSETRPVTTQGSGQDAGGKGEGPPTAPRRLHPVKPLNPLEQQPASVTEEPKDNKSPAILSGGQEKVKVNEDGLKGPYTQLTQEELISLVMKQDNMLLERDKTISQLEQYIDNLLVRVMEEKPSILMSIGSVNKGS